jgi:hypothetical protein
MEKVNGGLMLNFLKNLFVFRVGQKSARGVARVLGFGRLGLLIGLVGGYRALKRHRHAHSV